MNSPLVTILSPCYNVGRFLPKYFETVLGQSYSDLQVVLIADGSKDDTWDVMQEYAAKDPRVEIYHQENQGVAATRNNLLDKVKGDYVLFVDSDDWIELDMVEYLVDLINKNDADVAMCGCAINDTPAEPEKSIKVYDRDTTIKEFLFHKEVRGSLWNKLWRGCSILLAFFQKINKLIISDRQLYHYRMVDTSLCHSSFGPKKLSAHYAWEQICEETAKW